MKVKKKAVVLALGMAVMMASSITAFAESGTLGGYNYYFDLSCSYNSATASTTYNNPENDSIYVSLKAYYKDANGDPQSTSKSASNSRGDLSITVGVTENTYQFTNATSTHQIMYNGTSVKTTLNATRK